MCSIDWYRADKEGCLEGYSGGTPGGMPKEDAQGNTPLLYYTGYMIFMYIIR